MTSRSHRLAAVAGFAALFTLALSAPSFAQKSKDTIRLAIIETFSSIDPYFYPLDEVLSFSRTIYQPLVEFDEHKGEFVPILAKAWRRVSPTVLEFDLRENVKFHNGNPFDADDVVATVNFLADPKTRIQFKSRYDWAHAEKVDKYKVRIIAKEPFAVDMSTLAYRFSMLDAETMKSLSDVSEYGRLTPYGTGSYKVASFDVNAGLTVERVDNYYGDAGYYRAPAKRVQAIPMPDRQTQIAQLLTGGLDLLRNVTVDDVGQFANNPNFEVTDTPSGQLIYITLDAAGRSQSKLMTDERVRKALIMAIDRDLIVKNFVPGGQHAEIPLSICFKSTIACAPTNKPYPYNPAEAKKLLAEAGYPDGVDLVLNVFSPIKQIGEAIAGEIRKSGFRASAQVLTRPVMAKKRGDGELTAYLGYYPISGHPDAANAFDFFFGGDRNYSNDPQIMKAYESGAQELDIGKRAALYAPALNLINTKAYILPVSELPMLFVHSKDVAILPNKMTTAESRVGDYAWK